MSDRERDKDPFQRFREFLDRAERELNDFFAERSTREDANRRRARFADVSLDAQKRIAELWARTFHGMNLPTRDDVISLGKRIAEVENALVRIEAAVRNLLQAKAEAPAREAAAPKPRVPRTRVPPAGASPPPQSAEEGAR